MQNQQDVEINHGGDIVLSRPRNGGWLISQGGANVAACSTVNEMIKALTKHLNVSEGRAPRKSLNYKGGKPKHDWGRIHEEITARMNQESLPAQMQDFVREIHEWCSQNMTTLPDLSTLRKAISPHWNAKYDATASTDISEDSEPKIQVIRATRESELDGMVPAPRVLAIFGVSDMTLSRWLKSPTVGFPKPVYISKKRYWKAADLEAFQSNLKHKSGAETAKQRRA